LITQFEITTSTLASGSGTASIRPARKLDVRRARLGRVAPRQLEHLVGHVYAVGEAGRAHPPRREQDVDPAPRAQVEHALPRTQVRDDQGVPATEAGEQRGLGYLAGLVGPVEPRRLQGGLGVATPRAIGAAARRPAAAVEHRPGGLRVAATDVFDDLIIHPSSPGLRYR
jgi:hypothetical protein